MIKRKYYADELIIAIIEHYNTTKNSDLRKEIKEHYRTATIYTMNEYLSTNWDINNWDYDEAFDEFERKLQEKKERILPLKMPIPFWIAIFGIEKEIKKNHN